MYEMSISYEEIHSVRLHRTYFSSKNSGRVEINGRTRDKRSDECWYLVLNNYKNHITWDINVERPLFTRLI
jgi:hypothetical protein